MTDASKEVDDREHEAPLGTPGDLARCYERLLDPQEENVSAAEPERTPARVEASSESESSPPPLRRIVEAMLFVGGAPLTAERAAEAVRGLTAEQFREIIDGLNRDYRRQGRPYRIQVREQGYELVLQPRFRGVHERLYGATREARLSPAALDVLALVAYRQPISKQEVEALRGGESSSALRQLVRLGLIAVQRGEANQREVVYSTTSRFLSLFQLRSLEDLPRTQDLQKL
ncbi:MAG TPA: SMC-Scp complex subunit ScpB [Gemmataceae bacterium]|nr:SMC-Scp complex subunit ScpB [Gemmataceae bacterium]